MSRGTILKDLKLTSVDLVKRGANPDADICLYKSAEQVKQVNNNEAMISDEDKPLFKKFWDTFKATFAPIGEDVQKDAQTFDTITSIQEVNDNMWKYFRALEDSIRSIIYDGDIDSASKSTLLTTTLDQFNAQITAIFPALIKANETKEKTPVAEATAKSIEGDPSNTLKKGESDNMATEYDTSTLTEEEKKTFDALTKKCKVKKTAETDPAPAGEPTTDPAPAPAPAVEKSAEEVNPALAKALEELETMKKSMEMSQLNEVAKKYEPLGKKVDELASTLYDLKKSGQANYDAYISALDANLEMVEKSGIFNEVGKSTHNSVSGNTYAKVEEIAKGIMNADGTNYNDAMVKAWEQNPNLVAEYERERG